MPLLDGRYEVIGQRSLGGGVTEFEATAPDGAPLRIEWFDLPTEKERNFEAYRRLLRSLKRAGVAAVHDVIARPGAHYVAWEEPPPNATRVAASDAHAVTFLPEAGNGAVTALSEGLAAAGYSLAAADLRRLPTRPPRVVLYGLAFGSAKAPAAPSPAKPAEVPRSRPLRQQESLVKRAVRALAGMSGRALSWSATLILVLAAASILVARFWTTRVDAVVTVPELVGEAAQGAVDQLTALGLGVSATPLQSDEPPGTVLAVEPAAGTSLRPGRTVFVRYALPSGELSPTEVPSLLGLRVPGEVERVLDRAGLRLGDVARIHAPSPAGVVLAQDLDPGNLAGSGSAVAVLVSLGPAPVRTFVPDLVGLELAEARALAQVAGIPPERVFVDEINATTGARGTVLNQSLAPNVPVDRDDAVLRLVVQAGAGGPQPTSAAGAPDVVGMSLAQAQQVAQGWNVEVTTLSNPGLPVGVVAQDPPPAMAGSDARLTLTVNAHPVRLTAPGAYAVVRTPTLRDVPYAWTIQPGIRTQEGEVWASDLSGKRTLVSRVTVRGGEVLRGTYRTVTAEPVTFELLIGGVPYGEPLLVP